MAGWKITRGLSFFFIAHPQSTWVPCRIVHPKTKNLDKQGSQCHPEGSKLLQLKPQMQERRAREDVHPRKCRKKGKQRRRTWGTLRTRTVKVTRPHGKSTPFAGKVPKIKLKCQQNPKNVGYMYCIDNHDTLATIHPQLHTHNCKIPTNL